MKTLLVLIFVLSINQFNVWAKFNFQQYPNPEIFMDSGLHKLDSVLTYQFVSETDSSLLIKEFYNFKNTGELTDYEGIKWKEDSNEFDSKYIGKYEFEGEILMKSTSEGFLWKEGEWSPFNKSNFTNNVNSDIREEFVFSEQLGNWILVFNLESKFNKDKKIELSNSQSYSYQTGELYRKHKAEFYYSQNGKLECLKNFNYDLTQNSWDLQSNASYHYHQNQELDSMIMDQWHKLPDGEILHRLYLEDYEVKLREERPNYIVYDWDTTSLSWEPYKKEEIQKKEFEIIENGFKWENESNSWKNHSITITELNEEGKNVRFEWLSTNYNQEKFGNRKMYTYDSNGYKLSEENFDWDNDINDWVIKEKKYYFYDRGELANLEESITVYPNPANEELNITMENPLMGELTISIYDMQGRMLKNVKLEKENFISKYLFEHLDISEGAYILKFNIGNHSAIKRFVRH